ncbi:hypothetical protein, partial [Gottfriedia acidiceleris]|uniref:hypothetical protein n=1 Tax=Gottfriedia acidiceleris TaxID=371036 RepID=UPI0030008DB6
MNFTKKLTVVALTSTLSILTLPIVSLAESEINKIEEKKVTIQKRTKESKKKIDELKKKQEQILNDLE